ncbi:site-2 protease family protein [Natronorubrum daqingense]|uniref:Metalloprotease n=1 Tax=Natronorubrum daqingense TaxID=588898 RepID=A0A1N7AJG4_9EURY|nr:site-2 protease family protein [Natronorubrum daqingense]APX97962.1 metalloprotease [Natronorubrum daqingense]SIR39113.1 PDZ domain-containing protein [Natronorubrum daqingense]
MEYGFPAVVSVPELYGSETLTWVVIGLLVYWAAIIALDRAELFPEYVGTQGPILTFRTKRGRAFLDWLSVPKRFWRAWANLGVGIAVVVMVTMFVVLLFAAISAIMSPEPAEGVQQPRNVVPFPGVNDFLPLSATPGIVVGLLVGLVVHEGGHGLLCRVEDMGIKSMGVAMLAIIPFGAFVEPDQESSRDASRGAQTRMFAAGVTNNFAITLLVFALLFGPIAGSIAVAPGAAVGGVAPDSPAAGADIEPNERITAVDGEAIDDNDDLIEYFEESDSETVELELDDDRTVSVDRSVFVTEALEDGPADIDVGETIVEVEGEPVATEQEFVDAIGDEEVVTLTVEDAEGETSEREVPIGAAVDTTDDGPLGEELGDTDETVIITAFDGERVTDYSELESVLEDTEAGDEVSVTVYADDEDETVDVTLDDHPRDDIGFLGIVANPGTSGFDVSDIGVQFYPADEYLAILGGGENGSYGGATDSFFGKIALSVFLPVIGVIGLLPFNFAGFTGGVENFYEVQGSLAALGDSTVFILANILFWTGWINVQLGFFNCIPAFPLDGGHILRTSTEAVVSRLPFETNRGHVRTVTTSVGLTMLVCFLTVLFLPFII